MTDWEWWGKITISPLSPEFSELIPRANDDMNDDKILEN